MDEQGLADSRILRFLEVGARRCRFHSTGYPDSIAAGYWYHLERSLELAAFFRKCCPQAGGTGRRLKSDRGGMRKSSLVYGARANRLCIRVFANQDDSLSGGERHFDIMKAGASTEAIGDKAEDESGGSPAAGSGDFWPLADAHGNILEGSVAQVAAVPIVVVPVAPSRSRNKYRGARRCRNRTRPPRPPSFRSSVFAAWPSFEARGDIFERDGIRLRSARCSENPGAESRHAHGVGGMPDSEAEMSRSCHCGEV